MDRVERREESFQKEHFTLFCPMYDLFTKIFAVIVTFGIRGFHGLFFDERFSNFRLKLILNTCNADRHAYSIYNFTRSKNRTTSPQRELLYSPAKVRVKRI